MTYDPGLSWAVELIRTDLRRLTELTRASLEQGRRIEVLQRDLLLAITKLHAPSASAPPQRPCLSIGDWCKVGGAVLVLILVVAGKLTWTDALPVLRSLLGAL